MNFRGDDRARRNAGPDRPRGERDDHRDSNDRPVRREGGPNGDQRGRDSPHRNEEERAERQRRERQRFEQAAASAMAKQRRDDSIDQAVAEITARQQALDGDIATEITAPPRPREGEAAPAPPFGERPSAPPGPPPAPEPDRVFAAWPGGWRSQNSPEAPVDISGLEEQLRQMTKAAVEGATEVKVVDFIAARGDSNRWNVLAPRLRVALFCRRTLLPPRR